MCGIIGIFNKMECFSDIVRTLEVISPRGKDGVGVCSIDRCSYSKNVKSLKKVDSKNILAHNLHSVVGRVNQPIKKKGIISSNCEIYNWKELKERFNLKSKNDSELIIDLIEKKGINKIKEVLGELDGVYAFAYWVNDKVYIARDIIGLKPVWYSNSDGFAFASEKKALEVNGFKDIEELNPRTILVYDLESKKVKRIKRKFFEIGKLNRSKDELAAETEELILNAVKKRIPDKKFGLLFSGGIDSTFLAYVFKKLGRDFICYTAALEEKGMEDAQDLIYAKKIAKRLGLKLRVSKLSLRETRKYLEKVTPLIEDNNVVKVGVGMTFFAACELAKKDGIKVIFSGLGSEEIFAGYERHKKSSDINKECLSGLIKIYERDLYRDDVITMHNSLELRVPFLDKELVKYALKIPVELKLKGERNKIILRDISKKLGVPEEFAERKKKAAQYGSKFDRAIGKLAKKEGFSKKSDFLYQFYHPPNAKLGILWSSGKDSAFAAWRMLKQNYQISCLISLKSRNLDSYMFHTPNIDLVRLQAKSMGIPLIMQETEGMKEKELVDMKKAIKIAKDKYAIQGVVTGAIFSNYQRSRVEKICDELGLKIFSPLWHIDQEKEMREIIQNGFKFIISKVAAYGLDESWLGRIITEKDVDNIVKINKKMGMNVAFEGGEAETLMVDGPMFEKKIKIKKAKVIMENENTGLYNVIEAGLE
ncbi:MAG: diphthine--ammonia ligase [Nanoarchaeota archaeon]|nr:diphthine--ammonia ligase [Nanoarchaeota archaeon]